MASSLLQHDACELFAARKITFVEKRLGWPAFQLRCVVSNAAMHLKKSGTFRR
jgi:hypothetical protein